MRAAWPWRAAVLPRAQSPLAVAPVQWQRMVGSMAVPGFLSSLVAKSSIKCASACAAVQQSGDRTISLEAVLEIDARTRRLAETRCESYMSGAFMAKTQGGV